MIGKNPEVVKMLKDLKREGLYINQIAAMTDFERVFLHNQSKGRGRRMYDDEIARIEDLHRRLCR